MVASSFEMYGRFVTENYSDMEKSGRYAFMEGLETEIVSDIKAKLNLNHTDEFLEIGFGSGIVLRALAGLVASANGIDHPNFVKVFEAENPGVATLIGADFLDVELSRFGKFDKILIYSVLHCLGSEEEVTTFLRRALSLLRPGGRALLGDLPNSSAKKRLLATRHGRSLEDSWRELVKKKGGIQPKMRIKGNPLSLFDDKRILRIIREIREDGYEAYLVPQANGLPFSQTREDILVIARHE